MTAQDFVNVLENSDMMRIVENGKDIFISYCASLRYEDFRLFERIKQKEVQRFRAVPEMRHRKWEELNLMQPLRSDETPDFCFSDLQMKLYYTIYI